MVELGRVKYSELETWQSYVESSRVKYSHDRFIYSQVE